LPAKDLDAVKARGTLICGVTAGGIAGFMMVDSQGKWTGLDVDICRATASGDLRRLGEGQLRAAVGPDALHRAAVGRGRPAVEQSTWTLTRDSALGLDFVGVTY
jgi:general L-amino acid transport system substrate-binding protein